MVEVGALTPYKWTYIGSDSDIRPTQLTHLLGEPFGQSNIAGGVRQVDESRPHKMTT